MMFVEVQKAIYRALSNAGFTVYDHIPSNTSFPYITLGEENAMDWSTKTFQGLQTRFDIHIWSRYPGMKEVKEIADQILALLNYRTLLIDSHTLVLIRLIDARFMKDPGENVRHGILRFEILSTGG